MSYISKQALQIVSSANAVCNGTADKWHIGTTQIVQRHLVLASMSIQFDPQSVQSQDTQVLCHKMCTLVPG